MFTKSTAAGKPVTFFTHPPSVIALVTGFLLTVWAYLQPERSSAFLIVGFFSAIFLAVYLFVLGAYDSSLDELTGFFRKKEFLLLAEQHRKLAMRRKTGFYLMLAEVRPRNNNAVRIAAEIFRSSVRAADLLARIKKDMFVLLAIDASQDSRTVIEKRLSEKMASHYGAARLSDTPSVIVASVFFNPNDACSTIEELLETAGKKLYDEKKQRSES